MTRKPGSLRRLVLLFLTSLFAVTLSACDSTNDNDFVVTPGTLSLAGRYLGASNVSANQASTLDVTVAANGSITGNLTVLAPVVPQTINTGTYPVTGAVNLNTGTFSLSGTIPGLGAFSISGTLPTSGNVGTYTITINGQTFNGVIQPASLGQPNPPSNTNNGGGNSQIIQGGTLSNFMFTPDGNYNGDNPPVDAMSIIGGAVGEGADGSESASIILSEVIGINPSIVRTFAITIVVPSGENLQVGTTYNLADTNGRGTVFALTDSEGVTAVEGWSLTASTTGSATITAMDANSITIDFTFSSVGPNSEIANNPATGTFSTSGTIVGNFATIP